MFLNREEAGVLLAKKLINYSNKFNAVVVAIPRGGVPVGAVIATTAGAATTTAETAIMRAIF